MSAAPAAPITRLGLIGGSSFLESSALRSFRVEEVQTPFGPVILRTNEARSIVFVQRHAADPTPGKEYSPPHLINYRAIAKALQQVGVSHVIAFGSTGSLKRTLPVGSLLVPDDWLHFSPISTFDYAKGGHVGTGLDETLRAGLLSMLRDAGLSPLDTGVYAQALGPRFETPAEIRSLAIQGGDIVGMTCAHEATLCRELSLPYALVCIVDNMANGVSGTEISYEEFHAGVKRNLATMERILGLVLQRFAPAETEESKAAVAAAAAASSSKRQVDSVVHARWMVPIEPANVVLENHALVVHEGKIVDVLPSSDAAAKYAARNEERFTSEVLMPGFVNAHSHLGMSLMRGYADDYCLSEWLTKHIWPGEAVFVCPDFVRDSCELGMAEMIRGGTTAMNDMYWFPEILAELADKVGMRALVGLIVIDFPTSYAKSADEYLEKGLALYERMKGHARVAFSLAPHAPYTVCDANLKRIGALARERVLRSPTGGSDLTAPAKLHVHLHETRDEVVNSASLTPSMATHRSEHACRPLHNFDANLGLLNSDLIAVHMTQLSDEEVARVAATQSSVVHCPTSNLKLASGFCPVSKLCAHGVNVALGTDSTASNNGLDMLAEVKLAAVLAKAVADDAASVPAYQALRMATLNGAKALGMEQVTGSLEVGKSADFIAVRLDELEALPLFNVFSHLAYAAGREHVTDVWVAGRRLMRARKLLTLDEASIKARTLQWQTKMAAEKAKQAAAAAAEADAASANGKKRAAPDAEDEKTVIKPKH